MWPVIKLFCWILPLVLLLVVPKSPVVEESTGADASLRIVPCVVFFRLAVGELTAGEFHVNASKSSPSCLTLCELFMLA